VQERAFRTAPHRASLYMTDRSLLKASAVKIAGRTDGQPLDRQTTIVTQQQTEIFSDTKISQWQINLFVQQAVCLDTVT